MTDAFTRALRRSAMIEEALKTAKLVPVSTPFLASLNRTPPYFWLGAEADTAVN